MACLIVITNRGGGGGGLLILLRFYTYKPHGVTESELGSNINLLK